MCLDCGCHDPDNAHGDHRHITIGDLHHAAVASGVSDERAVENISDTFRDMTADDPADIFARMMRRPVVIFDIDDTIAFSSEAFMCALNAAFDTRYLAGEVAGGDWSVHLTGQQDAWLSAQKTQSDIYENIAPNWHGIDTMVYAKQLGYVVMIASARSSALHDVTMQWLTRWNVPYDSLNLLGTGRKPDWIRGKFGPGNPAILIDDQPRQWLAAGDGVSVWTPRHPRTPSRAPDGVWIFDDWESVRAALADQL